MFISKLFSRDQDSRSERKSQKSDREFYRIEQGSNYEIVVDVTGDAPYSTCVISINVVTGGERKLPIAARFSWKRFRRDQE